MSITEATIKSALGKLRNADRPDWCMAAGLTELALTAKHGAAIANFPALRKHDPFDRMLLAQARVEGLPPPHV